MERHKKAVRGPVNAVPCPWCGQHNDLSDLLDQQLLEEPLRDEDGKTINRGSSVDCDHCKRLSTVEKIDHRPRVILRQKHT